MTYPPSVFDDARNRAWRTFVQGLGIDLALALGTVLTAAMTNVEWTRTYWVGVAVLAGRTLLHTAVSYVARRVLPPAV